MAFKMLMYDLVKSKLQTLVAKSNTVLTSRGNAAIMQALKIAKVAAGGALAVHFKFKADDRYDQYLETGDPEFKDQVQQYDTYSYVALAGMQVGIGVLVFRLAF